MAARSPRSRRAAPAGPLRASHTAICSCPRLSPPASAVENTPDTQLVLQTLTASGASFFSELVQKTHLLPSRVEQALAELVTQGLVTSDSFEGLRALLVPSEKRVPFADVERKRRHRSVTSVEFAGRWYLLRTPGVQTELAERDAALEIFARVLLRRYGVVFRRMIERESFSVSWYDLGRIYRRIEAQGEIRGGYFVSGVSGEQFAFSQIGYPDLIPRAVIFGLLCIVAGMLSIGHEGRGRFDPFGKRSFTYQKSPEHFPQGAGAIEVALSVGKHQIFLDPGTTDFAPLLFLICLVAIENINHKDRQLYHSAAFGCLWFRLYVAISF